jgi:cell division protein FtsA
MAAQCVLGLDIGTATIKVAVAENHRGRPFLVSILKESSSGLRKGAIVDLAEASSAVSRVLQEVKKIEGAALKNVYLNIGTTQIKAQHSHGVVAVSRADSEIYQDDIDRAVKASQAVAVSPNRMIVHNVTREYIVDGVGDISDPLGLSGNRLEVQSIIIDAFAPHVKNLIRAVELAGCHIGGMVISPLTGSRAALSKAQKDLGTALIDIGYGTTGLCVYEENKLVGVANFPIGAGNITNDLAVGLKIPVSVAENLKLHCGYAVAKEINPKEMIDLKKFSPENKGTVSRRFIAEIIESRLAEIFELINNELKLMGKAGQLAVGAVFIGGGAKLPGLTELAKEELKLTSQIGFTIHEEWAGEAGALTETFEDPELTNALGLVLWGADKECWKPSEKPAMTKIKSILRYFLP